MSIPLPSWLSSSLKPLMEAKQKVVRLATTNPVVAPILKQYRTKVPEPARRFINPRLNPLGKIQDLASLNSLLMAPNDETGAVIYGAGLLHPIAGTLAAVSQLGGDTPQGASPYANWQRLGYKSEQDMRDRIAAQIGRENAVALAGRLPAAGFDSVRNFVPPPPVADPQATNPVGSPRVAPQANNPVDASTPRLTTQAPKRSLAPAAAPIPQAAYEAAVTTGLAEGSVSPRDLYRAQEYYGRQMEESGELQRRLKDVGGAAGMSDEALMTWAQKNPALAYREMLKRERRSQGLSNSPSSLAS